MTNIEDVLSYLRPDGGWVIWGQDFETIRYDEGVKPITKKELDEGFASYEAWKNKDNDNKTLKRQAILDRLGITAEEAKLLLS
jgi:hypothetical protein